MERIRITDENVDELIEQFRDEWWTGKQILATFAKIQRHYLVDWSKDGRLHRIPIEPRPQRGARFLFSVEDAILARHRMRECKPFLNKIGPDGVRLFRCNKCEAWKEVDGFHANMSQGRGPGMHTHCKVCHARLNAEHRKNNIAETMKGRERARLRRRTTVARAKAVQEWEGVKEIDARIVVDFLERAYPDEPDTLLSDRCGSHPDLIRKVRKQAKLGRKIKFSTADTVLVALGGDVVLRQIIAEMERDRPAWHPAHPYCSRCMRTSVAHEAAGMCQTCYPRRDDLTYVPIMDGQWARRHMQCGGCGTTDRRHYGHGLCRRCWNRRQRLAAKVGSGHEPESLCSNAEAPDDRIGGRDDLRRVASNP